MKLSERFPPKSTARDLGKSLARRRRKLKPWSDFTLPAQTRDEDAGISELARLWLAELSQQELQAVFIWKNRWLVSVLLKMHLCKVKDGDCSFMLRDIKPSAADDSNFESSFIVRPKSQDLLPKNETVPAEMKLEEAIRLCDSENYLDTLTLAREALGNLGDLLVCFDSITMGKFLKTPCRAYTDGDKVSAWESPQWFKPCKMNSLASWAVAAFEKAVWAAYWKSTKLDCRRPNESVPVTYNLPCPYLQDIKVLEDYWRDLSHSRRIEVVGEYGRLQDLLKQAPKPQWIQMFWPESTILYTNKANDIIIGQVIISSEALTPQRRQILHYNSESSLAELYTMLTEGKPDQLLDFLYLTPLKRADSQLDAVARKVAYFIRDSHASKLAEELLTVEATAVKRLVPKKKKKPKAVKCVSGGRSSKSTSESSLSEHEGEHTSMTAPSKAVQIQLERSILEDEFVKVDRRKYRRPETVKKTTMKPKQNRPCKKISSPSFRPKPRPLITPGIVEWHEGSLTSSSVPKLEEFPPLMSPPKAPLESRLTSEIMKFVIDNSAMMDALRASRVILLDKIDALVRLLFPTGYLSLYGSCATHLDLPWSDIDLLVTNVHMGSAQELLHNLSSLAEILESQTWTESISVLNKAIVPVIKLKANLGEEGQDLVEIDITFDDSGLLERANLGMATTIVSVQFLDTYPILRLLVPVLKHLLRAMGYNSSYKGQL